MDEGLVHPLSLLKDSPRRFGGFTPENYDKIFLGPISVKDALIKSRNVPAVDLQSRLRKRSFYQFLQDAGISGLKQESFYGLALALGGGEVTMLELASLYAALANQGVLKPIRSLQKQEGHAGKRILSKEASFLILDILKDNPSPGKLNINIASVMENDIAWKTGTSWAFRDAWAVGISGPYVVVVWVGNFDGKGNNVFVGRSAAGPLMFSIFESIFPDQGWQVEDIISQQSLNLKKLLVCAATGDLYQKHCPSSVESWFIPGVSPIKVSNIYRKIPIDKETGLRACWHRAGVTEVKVYEFWPSDFLRIFNQAGIKLKTPPKYMSGCSMDQKSASGQMPVITSPQNTVEYIVNVNSDEGNLIPLMATVDPDVDQIYWFVDGKYVGNSIGRQAFLWQARPGSFQVRAVDDSGRGASKRFVVSQALTHN
jgi:penicillin-binding protein 1C